MSDKNLREELAKIFWSHPGLGSHITIKQIDSIHAAIAKDREEEKESSE